MGENLSRKIPNSLRFRKFVRNGNTNLSRREGHATERVGGTRFTKWSFGRESPELTGGFFLLRTMAELTGLSLSFIYIGIFDGTNFDGRGPSVFIWKWALFISSIFIISDGYIGRKKKINFSSAKTSEISF